VNHTINRSTTIVDLGLIDYKQAWDYQEKMFASTVEIKIENRKKPPEEQKMTPNFLIFCEHPHVYTLGKSGSADNLLVDEKGLEDIGASYYKINRGGDITYHGPGQIVCYPVIDLENYFTDIHKYLRYLEEAVILTCRNYGLETGRIEGLTGVWVDFEPKKNDKSNWNPRKICALGVKTSRWVTMHGLAFNIDTKLEYFDNIIPCGIDDKDVTTMSKELDYSIDISEVLGKLKTNLISVFGMTLID
jgi:lipoyl(octanoyl) transferase